MSRSLFARLADLFESREARFNRRQFLKLSAAGTAATFLSTRPALARNRANKRILIIGAGLSGLACAYELVSCGYEVAVLEARSRVGGRVLSFDNFIPGQIVEGGAELIGANHPHWNAYANRFGLPLVEVESYEEPEPWEFAGRILSESELESIYEESEQALHTLVGPAAGASLRDLEADRLSVADWMGGLDLSPLTRRALRTQFEANNCGPLEKQSYLSLLLAVKSGGGEAYFTDSETHRCGDGNQALARRFANELGDRVRLNCPVSRVVLADSGCRVELSPGEVIEGDDCVLAVPPSAWDRITFSPALPPDLKLSMGPAVKFLSAIEPGYFEQRELSPNSLGEGPVAYTWGAGSGLICFAGGPSAVALRAAGAESTELYLVEQLSRRYPDLANHVLRGRFMDWPGAAYTGSGYSCAAPGELTTRLPRLQAGVSAHLHFAGEHMSVGFSSFMEGALDAGVTVARNLAERDGVT